MLKGWTSKIVFEKLREFLRYDALAAVIVGLVIIWIVVGSPFGFLEEMEKK